MKNKTKTYVLITAVLLIWGIISYRIMSALNPVTSQSEAIEFSVNFNPKSSIKLDTFSVKKVKRDPFLGTIVSNHKKTKNKPKNISTIIWPTITYQGLVENKNTGQIFIVSINGNQSLLKRGTITNEVTIVNGNKKELTVKYKGKLKTISLKK